MFLTCKMGQGGLSFCFLFVRFLSFGFPSWFHTFTEPTTKQKWRTLKAADVMDRRQRVQRLNRIGFHLSMRNTAAAPCPRCPPHRPVPPLFRHYLGTMPNSNWVCRRWWGKRLCSTGLYRVRKRENDEFEIATQKPVHALFMFLDKPELSWIRNRSSYPLLISHPFHHLLLSSLALSQLHSRKVFLLVYPFEIYFSNYFFSVCMQLHASVRNPSVTQVRFSFHLFVYLLAVRFGMLLFPTPT